MKLYATVTSERASKGQGGNEFLEISITDEENDLIATIGLKPKRFVNDTQIVQIGYNGHFTKVQAHDMAEESSDFWGVKEKGNKQKTAKCYGECGEEETKKGRYTNCYGFNHQWL